MAGTIEIGKKILMSKWLRLILSVGLIYLAFMKVDILSVVKQLSQVPLWFVGFYIVYSFFSSFVGAYRWATLLLGKPSFSDVWVMVKSSYVAGFYALFLPSGMAVDLIKWLPLQKHYPELTKARLFSSVIVDRVVGFGAYVLVALTAMIIGRLIGFNFPMYLFWAFLGLAVGVIGFYIVTFTFDVEKVILRIKLWKFHRLVEIIRILKNTNRSRLIKCLVISVLGELVWMTPVWLISLVLNAGMSLISVFVFMPVIGLILILPISIAGFGARESLYLFFFGQLGLVSEKVLAVSALFGIMGIIVTLLGGLLTLSQDNRVVSERTTDF